MEKVAKKRWRAVKDAPEVTDEMKTVTCPKKRGRPAKNLSEIAVPAKTTNRTLAAKNIWIAFHFHVPKTKINAKTA